MKLSREAIERLMGPQPTITKTVTVEKSKEGWSPTTPQEREKILKIYQDNPTYTIREISNKVGRANSVVWKIIKEGRK
jgi:hypothetical protein